MSIITDFRKTVRSRIVGDRAVLAVNLPEPALRNEQLETEVQATNVLAATEPGPTEDALGADGPRAEAPDGPKTKVPSRPKIRAEDGRYIAQPGRDRRPARMVGSTVPGVNCRTQQDLAGPAASETATRESTDPAATNPVLKESKSGTVLRLLKRADGATLTEVMGATGWQAHSVRGFLSGTVRKKLGLNLISETDGDGARRYRFAPCARDNEPDSPVGSNAVVGALPFASPKEDALPTEPPPTDASTGAQVN